MTQFEGDEGVSEDHCQYHRELRCSASLIPLPFRKEVLTLGWAHTLRLSMRDRPPRCVFCFEFFCFWDAAVDFRSELFDVS